MSDLERNLKCPVRLGGGEQDGFWVPSPVTLGRLPPHRSLESLHASLLVFCSIISSQPLERRHVSPILVPPELNKRNDPSLEGPVP